jgi:hypothetical protein
MTLEQKPLGFGRKKRTLRTPSEHEAMIAHLPYPPQI